MNTATANFNTAVRQMAEMFQWPKCLSKNGPKYLSEKKYSSVVSLQSRFHPSLIKSMDDIFVLVSIKAMFVLFNLQS